MKNNTLIGRTFSQTTKGHRKPNGLWQIDVVITEQVIYPDGTEKEEKIESMAVDMDFDFAHQMALQSALMELGQLVYNRDFDSLIEAREYDREHNDSSEADEDTPTQ